METSASPRVRAPMPVLVHVMHVYVWTKPLGHADRDTRKGGTYDGEASWALSLPSVRTRLVSLGEHEESVSKRSSLADPLFFFSDTSLVSWGVCACTPEKFKTPPSCLLLFFAAGDGEDSSLVLLLSLLSMLPCWSFFLSFFLLAVGFFRRSMEELVGFDFSTPFQHHKNFLVQTLGSPGAVKQEREKAGRKEILYDSGSSCFPPPARRDAPTQPAHGEQRRTGGRKPRGMHAC